VKLSPFVIVLTALNVVALILLARTVSVEAQSDEKVIRTQVLELVDETGQLRSRLNVEEGGEVVLRMMDESGTIRLKLGADADGSGLTLLDDQTEPGVQVLAKPEGPVLKLFGENDKDLLLTP
jgi:hypothetical protein